MSREIIPASKEHEKSFRETFKLREDVADDPYWQAAYDYAATTKLYPDEMAAVGPILVRKEPTND